MTTTQTSRPAMAQQRLAYLALLAVASAWGATFVMVKEALDTVGPLTFVAVRFGLATVVMLPLLAWRRSVADPTASRATTAPSTLRVARFDRRSIVAGAVVGAFLFSGYALQTAGLQYTSAGRAGFITGLNVAIVPLLAALIGRQRIGRLVVVGVAVATVGMGALSLGDATTPSFDVSSFEVNRGDVLVLGCALAFALHILSVARFAQSYDAVSLAFVQIAAVALFATVAALAWEGPAIPALLATWPAAVFTGLVCTVVAFTIQVQAQRFISPTHTALVFSTEPVFAAVFAYLLGGEHFGSTELLGCALILLGMVLAQLDREGTTLE